MIRINPLPSRTEIIIAFIASIPRSPPRVKTNLPPNQTILSSKSPLDAATSPKIEDNQFAIVVNCKACLEITSISLDGGTIHAFQKHNWQLLVVGTCKLVGREVGRCIAWGGASTKAVVSDTRRRKGWRAASHRRRCRPPERAWRVRDPKMTIREGRMIDSRDHPSIRGEMID